MEAPAMPNQPEPYRPGSHHTGSHQPEVPGDPAGFRRVLGHFPTSVVAVTALAADNRPVGMTVGSFTSVSLDPPLIGFFPGRSSSTFPHIQAAGRFCVNLLGETQHEVCARLSASGGDKFAALDWRPAPSGAPIINGALAWLDCVVHSVAEAGDHLVVLGEVRGLQSARHDERPLVFYRGALERLRPPAG
jgi:flavin reductase (DIM6/NTAB) family NADH-FMN oxidoreductase RutF